MPVVADPVPAAPGCRFDAMRVHVNDDCPRIGGPLPVTAPSGGSYTYVYECIPGCGAFHWAIPAAEADGTTLTGDEGFAAARVVKEHFGLSDCGPTEPPCPCFQHESVPWL